MAVAVLILSAAYVTTCLRQLCQGCCQAAERTTDGNEGSSRDVNDPRAEPVHPHCRCLWRSLYWRLVRASRLHGSYRVWHRYSAGCDHYLPILRDLRDRTERDG